ncbi:MAG: sigma-E factor negative regulatory protein [Porticoccaceae bacterium]|nr:sigma-E factor negative regulatory protein [Pseudomonadales bacterium]MCP5171815.1 sigma-E factor negative regulatory protein [Pseudomonadales bacterium]
MSNSDSFRAEAISALMDGETDEMEFHRVLKDVNSNTESRDRWHRYQIASAAMRKELPERLVDLSGSIRDAIELEGKPSSFAQRFISPIGRFAVAASVALVAVLGVQQFNQEQQVTAGSGAPIAVIDPVEQSATPAQLPSTFNLPRVPVRTVSATSGGQQQQPVALISRQAIPDKATQEQIQKYLNELMLRHTENASLNTSQGMLPFARMPQKQPD